MRKRRAYAEIYNDLDSEIVNVFRMTRDNGEKLRDALLLTPFARDEFKLSYEKAEDDIERARRTIIRAFMGFGSDGVSGKYPTGFRACSNRSGTTPAHDWRNYAECFDLLINRLRGVVIENRDAREVMEQHDGPDTLHYVDPPYVFSTRTNAAKHGYKFEMEDKDHSDLADFLKTLKGFVILSGYSCDLYDDLYGDWQVHKKSSLADGALERTEILWCNRQPELKLI